MLCLYNQNVLQCCTGKLLLLLCFLGITACETKKDDLSEKVIHFPISWSEIQQVQKDPGAIQVEQWFDTLELVKSPNLDVILLVGNQLQRIICTEKYFIILSREALIARCRYDSTGFIYENVGRGPDEYDFLCDVVYDQTQGKLLVLTSYPNKIFTIDTKGNFISSYTLPHKIYWERLYMLQGHLFLFGSDFDQKTKIFQDVVAKFEEGSLTEPIVITKRLLDGTSAIYWTLGERQGHLVAGIHGRDSLFQISEDLTVTSICLNFAFEKKLLQNRITDQRFYLINENKILCDRCMPNGDILNCGHRFRYDFLTSEVDVSLGIWWGYFMSSDKNNIYCYMPVSLQEIFEKSWNNMPASTRKFYEPLRKALSTMDENDNPLLLRYHLRK